ncbi:unnamed protein product, partial [Ascophyllum nodosum]
MVKTTREERPGSSHYVIPKKGKMKGKTVGQRESTAPTQGIPPVVDDAPQEDEATAPEFTRRESATPKATNE